MKVKYLLIIFILCLIPLNVNATSDALSESFQTILHKAKVLEVVELVVVEDTEVQVLEIEIVDGKYKGEISTIKNTILNNGYDVFLNKGNYINVVAEERDDTINFYFYSFEKSSAMGLLIITFIICVLVIGGIKGVKALTSLILTICLIVYLLVPLLLKGYDPVFLGVLTCILATIITFTIMNGFTKKTIISIIGVTGGLVVAGLIAYVFSILSNVTGISSDSGQMLQYIPGNIDFNYKGLLFTGIIIGALGACMDVAMEITSSLTEIKHHNPKIKEKELIKSGFNIGKDIMGTMVNTLILAYTGGSLSMILLFVGFEKSLYEIVNLDSMATEIIRAISGSMGLLFAIPITIFAFIIIEKKGKNNV